MLIFYFIDKKYFLKMKQNKIKIIFVEQTKIIEKPKSLNKFKEKVSNIFNINFDVLTDVIINIKSPIDEF